MLQTEDFLCFFKTQRPKKYILTSWILKIWLENNAVSLIFVATDGPFPFVWCWWYLFFTGGVTGGGNTGPIRCYLCIITKAARTGGDLTKGNSFESVEDEPLATNLFTINLLGLANFYMEAAKWVWGFHLNPWSPMVKRRCKFRSWLATLIMFVWTVASVLFQFSNLWCFYALTIIFYIQAFRW